MIKKGLMIFLFVVCLPARYGLAEELYAVTANLPPFSMNQKYEHSGFLCEVVTEMMKRAQIDIKIKYWPWKRSQYIAQNKKDTLIFGVTRTRKREDKYAWLVKLLDTERVFVSTTNKIDDMNTARQVRNITVRFATPFDAELKRGGFRNYVIAHSEEENASRLYHGKVNAWMTLSHRAAYMWKVMGYDRQQLKIGKSLMKSSLYLAGHLSLRDNIKLKEKLQSAYDSMREDGSFDRLHMKYFGWKPVKG